MVYYIGTVFLGFHIFYVHVPAHVTSLIQQRCYYTKSTRCLSRAFLNIFNKFCVCLHGF